jgi:ubiquinone/menaquinone biosynthesis C-methylase UbiE
MRPVTDPEGVEVSHLISACQPIRKNILEIGCGHGNLTFQYAGLPRKLMGIDLEASELLLAKNNTLASEMNVSFTCAMGEALPFPARYFEIVIFASSF